MSEKRMFAKTIIDSDAFLDMPSSSQMLYFHLSMRADDEGFINNPKKIQKITNCSDDDLKLLIAKSFILRFESGVIVIKHWKLHNCLRKDRIRETVYIEEKSLLEEKENGIYTLCQTYDGQVTDKCPASVDKTSVDKTRLGEYSVPDGNNILIIKEIIEYLNNSIDTKYSYKTASTQKHINGRIADGHTLEEFKVVIDKKCVEWVDTDMQQYLRPETLFGTKFDTYLNQPNAKPKGSSKKANPFDELLREELENEQNGNNSTDENNKRFLPTLL